MSIYTLRVTTNEAAHVSVNAKQNQQNGPTVSVHEYLTRCILNSENYFQHYIIMQITSCTSNSEKCISFSHTTIMPIPISPEYGMRFFLYFLETKFFGKLRYCPTQESCFHPVCRVVVHEWDFRFRPPTKTAFLTIYQPKSWKLCTFSI